ncbi:polysaccharide lyase family protein [Salix suchowensis]|nr:polysaccharide lyase family protein [Salix suchowensis]
MALTHEILPGIHRSPYSSHHHWLFRRAHGGDCEEQTETGEEDAVFILESGASISNVIIGKAQAEGKFYRACGNCATSHERHVQVDNVCLKDGKEGTGINSNWGDTAILTNIKTSSKPSAANVCCAYEGVPKGSEPPKIGW